MAGFIKDDSDKCVIDSVKNFMCDDLTLDDECLGGNVRCKGNYTYQESIKECIQQDIPDCRKGEIRNIWGHCAHEEVRGNKPTNFIFNELGVLDCKKGYKLMDEEPDPPYCILDEDKGWSCERGVLYSNDGVNCCDEFRINETYKCSSEPYCPNGTIIDDECVLDGTTEEINCSGEWSPCLSDCKDSIFSIKRMRGGLGEPCKDDSGNILINGSRLPCKGLGACTKYKDMLCGANLNGRVIEDIDKWEWNWKNKNKRDRCDNIYEGTLDNCRRVQIGTRSTRKNCPEYKGKCMGNTHPREDVNCYSINKIPRENVYDIDRIGNGYDSCCEDFDAKSIVRRDNIDYEQLKSERRITSVFGDENKLREIQRLIR